MEMYFTHTETHTHRHLLSRTHLFNLLCEETGKTHLKDQQKRLRWNTLEFFLPSGRHSVWFPRYRRATLMHFHQSRAVSAWVENKTCNVWCQVNRGTLCYDKNMQKKNVFQLPVILMSVFETLTHLKFGSQPVMLPIYWQSNKGQNIFLTGADTRPNVATVSLHCSLHPLYLFPGSSIDQAGQLIGSFFFTAFSQNCHQWSMAAPLTRPIKEGEQTGQMSAKRHQVRVCSGEMLNAAANCTFVDSLFCFCFSTQMTCGHFI